MPREVGRVNAHVDPQEIVRELEDGAKALDSVSTKLVRLIREFEGEGDGAAWQPGPQLLWLDLVGGELDRIATEYEDAGKRPPAKEVLQVRAEKAARRKDPVLYAEFHRLRTEISAMQKWISAKKEAISARQSALKGVP